MAPMQSLPGEPDALLRGIRVVDLSRLVSGNMTTHVFADLGATVIEVEPPGKGDELRAWQREGMSTYWMAYCRNKQSVVLDLRSDEGKQALRSLLSAADVLVVVRISGWGQTGAYASKGGFGSLIEAMSGFAAMNGFPDRPPVPPPFAMADSVAGLYGATLALAALRHRDACEDAALQEVDLSLFEPLFSILGPQAAEYQLSGKATPRSGSRSPTHAPPYRINGARPRIERAAPALGQDSQRWLQEGAA